MRSKLSSQPDSHQAVIYQIRIKGHLDGQWADWFGGVTITLEEDDNTLLTGPVADQAALHGLLKKVRDLGMPLISVTQARFNETLSYRSIKEADMNTTASLTKKIDTRIMLSTLWVVVMLSMLKADILSLYIPSAAEEVGSTAASTGASIPQLMLGGAIMGELAMVMIILSRVLKQRVNRWVNIVMGVVTTAYIWGGAAPYPHYTFIAIIETICLLLIIWNAWQWRDPEK